MKKLFLLLMIVSLFFSGCATQKNVKINSPSKSLAVKITNAQEGLKLFLKEGNQELLNIDLAKFVINNDSLLNSYKIKMKGQESIDETWQPVYGEKSDIQDRYNQVILSLTHSQEKTEELHLVCRVYDEGIAFRYLFNEKNFYDRVLEKELNTFNFDNDYESWITPSAQGTYQKQKISKIDITCERPLVIKRNRESYLAIGEAALVDYARMKFIKDPKNSLALQTTLDGAVDLAKAGYATPWRYVMVADSPGKLLENNYFILNLNEKCKIKDVSWIKPGKVIREVTLTTTGGKACIDFAARHNLQYVEFDAGWYGHEYDENSDARTISVDPKRSPGPLDLHEIVKYGESKGIGILLYINRRALEKQIDEVLPLYKSWGIKGLKYGFVNVGPQEWTSWLHEAIRKAAEYELMVDVHDEYRPTGYSRTYPNFMTQEGIRGDEESPSTEHTLMTLFTRMIAGAGDNTNCYSASRVSLKMGGKAAQMAKAVMLYSPWQFLYWYDRPGTSPVKKGGAGNSRGLIIEDEAIEFFDALPTVWDDTNVVEGEIGEYATIARKSGEDWFLGTLVANQERTLELPLDFLDKGENYNALIYYQNEQDLANDEVRIESENVTRESVLSKHLMKNSGLAVIFRKM